MPTTYEDLSPARNCIVCPNKCYTCANASVCSFCNTGIGRTTNLPNCECDVGFYDNGTNDINC